MNLLSIVDFSLPLTDPVLKFLLILLIILAAPLLLNRLKIPHLLGLIIAGAIIGPNGLNLILRDSSIILSGTAGLLYIMFLAGLEIDMGDFKKNGLRSLTFGMYTFLIPMIIGTAVGYWILKFSWETSILLASMFASHTLIAYPIISKLGATRNKAVGIAVGGTMITDTLALLVLTIIVGLVTGQADNVFWIRLGVSVVLFGFFIMLVFPLVSRLFFKHVHDSVSQYIFVLVLVFLGAFLAELAGVEAIIGAFLAGLALNRLIPHSSPLMNRVEFVGNAIFIPFFLLGVGMLVDYRAFFTSIDTIKVGLIMIVVATFAKFAAAWLTQKTFRLSVDQRRIIFGLSNAQAAATLAAVMVGYNVILGTDAAGNPIRLLNESVLNGTILMILVTCTIATFSAQKGAHNIALKEEAENRDEKKEEREEQILIPVGNEETVEELVMLSLSLKSKNNTKGIFALNVIDNQNTDSREVKNAYRILDKAEKVAAAADTRLKGLLRYDLNVSNGISGVVKERNITDMIVGLHRQKDISVAFLGNIIEKVLHNSNTTTFVYKPIQPLSTISRNIVILPLYAEKELGFAQAIERVSNVSRNIGARMMFYGAEEALTEVKRLLLKQPGESTYMPFSDWDDFLVITKEVKTNDSIWIFLSRKERLSYNTFMPKIPGYMNKYFRKNSYVLVYPIQVEAAEWARYLS